MTTAQDAHTELAAHCGSDCGIAVSLNIFDKLLKEQITRVNDFVKSIKSTQTFKRLAVSFDTVIDSTKLLTRFDRVVDPGGTSSYGIFVIDGFRCVVSGKLDGDTVCRLEIEWSTLVGRLSMADGHLSLSLEQEIHDVVKFEKLWESDILLKEKFDKKHSFNDTVWKDLALHMYSAGGFSAPSIASSIMQSIEVPDLFATFSGLVFSAIPRLEVKPDLLLLAVPAKIDIDQCAVARAKGGTKAVVTAKANGKTIPIGKRAYDPANTPPHSIEVTADIDESSPNLRYPPIGKLPIDTGASGEGHLFFYTPVTLFEHSFDGVIKPSIELRDKKQFGPFYFRYGMNAAPKGRIAISLASIKPLEFVLSLPLDVRGEAGAGIKIGSIVFEALGATFRGEVDPLDIGFKITLCVDRGELVFISKINTIKAQPFTFAHFPPIGFPLDQIVDVILGHVTKVIVESKSDTILSATRVPIANLRMFESVGTLLPEMASAADAVGNATTGLKFKFN